MSGSLCWISSSILFLCAAAAARTPNNCSTRFRSSSSSRANSARATITSSISVTILTGLTTFKRKEIYVPENRVSIW
ncbi:hypothetical protein F5J12DRAFT_825184 [Pisolithus orientalis]|uniref:uncharacterized protein n=1 Tax=Pisolithus orientalis TaxID=936130 RepID=UPI002225246B|nr:uncharacterized protein F5J12DRAFT_825184 [Pisolithus orientalis]KAI6008730.1 hypothetical protein F5J12DRAFT_825184 [Pisolithus orientalis]